ncbi:MAG: hypothetical protein R3F19_33060 [Verrucomicrobiales bacterium]
MKVESNAMTNTESKISISILAGVGICGLLILASLAEASPRLTMIPIVQAENDWDPDIPGQQGDIAAGPDGDFHMTYWRLDSGAVFYRSWSRASGLNEPVQIATSSDSLVAPPSIAVDARGTVHVAFVSKGSNVSYTARPRNGSFRGTTLFQNGKGIAQVSIVGGGTVREPRVALVYLSRTDKAIDTPGAFEVIYAESSDANSTASTWGTRKLGTTPHARCTPAVVFTNDRPREGAAVGYVADDGQNGNRIILQQGTLSDAGDWPISMIDRSDSLRDFTPTISLRTFSNSPGLIEVGYGKGGSAYTKLGGQAPVFWFKETISNCIEKSASISKGSFAGTGVFVIDLGVGPVGCEGEDSALSDVSFVAPPGSGSERSHVAFARQSFIQVNAAATITRNEGFYLPPSQPLPVDSADADYFLGNPSRLVKIAATSEGRVGMLFGRRNESTDTVEMVLAVSVPDSDDLDRDGASILLEEAMGASDSDPDDYSKWRTFPDKGTVFAGTLPFLVRKEVPAFTFQRRTNAKRYADGSYENFEGLRCIPEVSTDLQSWSSGNGQIVEDRTFPNFLRPGWEFVTYRWPDASPPRNAHFRIRIESK